MDEMEVSDYILKVNTLIENYKKMHEIDNETIKVLKKIIENKDQQIAHLNQMIDEFAELIKEAING